MSQFFRDYFDAHTAAVKLARQLNKDVGIEKFEEYNTPGCRVFSLPGPKFRFGHELRCQVVTPDEPFMSQDQTDK